MCLSLLSGVITWYMVLQMCLSLLSGVITWYMVLQMCLSLLSGVITWYMVLQIFFWWLSHVATLFINVKFPVVARSIRKSNRTFIPHIATVTLAVFLPLGTIIAAFPTGGFTNFHTIPPLCSPQNVELLYYGCVLPIGIILALGTPMLASTLWIIIKVNLLLYMFTCVP